MKQKISGLIALCMLGAMFMNLSVPVARANSLTSTNTEYEDRYIHTAKIVNRKDMNSDQWLRSFDDEDANVFPLFHRSLTTSMPGISVAIYGEELDKTDFTPEDIDHVEGHFIAKIQVSAIPALKRLAEGGNARFMVKAGMLNSSSDHGAWIWAYTSKIDRTGSVNGEEEGNAEEGWNEAPAQSKWSDVSRSTDDDKPNVDSGWLQIAPDDEYIIFETETNGAGTSVDNVRIYFGDIVLPQINNYDFISDGNIRFNQANQQELLLKKGQSFNFKFNFNKPVLAQVPDIDQQDPTSFPLKNHMLFTVPEGNGLPTDNQNLGMRLELNSQQIKEEYTSKLPYVYVADEHHHSGNNPIDSGELTTQALNEQSLWTKIDEAKFHDAAGNPLQMTGFSRASNISMPDVAGQDMDPFDHANGGYRVIVDAVPPRYSLTANGIQPDILTGSTLNKGDFIDFKVQLTEETILNEQIAGNGGTYDGLYLFFNNGMKAKYVNGKNTKVWTFRAEVTEDIADVALLKAIAWTHESKGDNSDKGVIQDYAGNLLMDSAYADKAANPDHPGLSTPNTKIDGAQLAIDNTKPDIRFLYDAGGATNATYKRSGKMTIDASDPSVTTPALDPDQSMPSRPSRGIYRPINMTGSEPGSSANVGLVYYYWSQSPDNPLAGKESDNFAAIKRYSLTGKQPKQDLYPAGADGFTLLAANNKTNVLSPPPVALTPEGSGKWYLHAWTADITWESARELMQYRKMKDYKAANAAQFETWIQEYKNNNPGGSDTDAEVYAERKAFGAVGSYSDLSVWPLSDFKRDDSNWVYNLGEIRFDNLKPTLTIGTPNGDNTAEVTVPVVIEDEHSGLNANNLLFQWVRAGGKVSDINWSRIPDSRVITTLHYVDGDGEYELYVKAEDKAGNAVSAKLDGKVKVNSEVAVKVVFEPDATEGYVKSHDITFGIQGMPVDKVEYAFTASSSRPAANLYKDITSGDELRDGYRCFTIPANKTLNGDRFLHIKVKEKDQTRYLYYAKPYRFDNKAPEVSFSPTSVSYAKEKHRVVVSMDDTYSSDGMTGKYQWVKSTGSTPGPAPDEASAKWVDLPDNGGVIIDNRELEREETADYTLYVNAVDGAGNRAIKETGTFKVIKKGDAPIVIGQTDVIYAYGDANDGFYAVLKLELDNTSKEGYEYSVSTDGGATWSAWAPYSNFVEVQIEGTEAERLNKLQARFRTSTGKLSETAEINASGDWQVKPVYGIAAPNTLRKTNEVTLAVEVASGIAVSPSPDVNPSVPERTGIHTFKVTQSGVYSFELQDTVDRTRKATLLVVVSNIDNTPPEGSIEYSMTRPTSSNVLVKLETNEAVRILNNEGRSSRLFTENGEFEFEFEDEAGNRGTATAEVTNIDRTPPHAVIEKSYTYGENGSKEFKTVRNGSGDVILSQGVTLELDKASPDGKDFKSVRGGTSQTLYGNGTAEFAVQDDRGNMAVLSEEIDNIVAELPEPEVEYRFVDDQGNEIPEDRIKEIDGIFYAKGHIKVTIRGEVDSPNEIFVTTPPYQVDENTYSSQKRISDGSGGYEYSLTFEANGEKTVVLTDLVGNTRKVRIKTEGLDNTPPTIALKSDVVAVKQNKENFDPAQDLGGFTVSDNVSGMEALMESVTVSGLDLSRTGPQTVTYTVRDEVGNVATVTQKVVVMAKAGLLIVGNGQIVSSSMPESILFDTNEIPFRITGFDEMSVNGQPSKNELAQYDLYYYSGLYREGQMKSIANKLTMTQLSNQQFKVTFPDTGWYTIVVRTQEREREFAMFFIGNVTRQVEE